ncbi:sodium-dependent proline transporter [Rhipicephalus sanguineus]|uniref:sodium-dependent proline transporter n=1 Tax=Rhipicephalus sanguineus TaxID=34632 RepID=UPI0020C5A90C|nr:sodium-dependent proline transporter [Rhipicephalus sanguineus]
MNPRSPPPAAAIRNARVAVREKWSNHMEFLCSCIGNSVGLGNLWRFPYVAYKNGGAAFLVPYIIINMLVGRPIYYLELLLGQFSSSGPLGAFRLSPMFQGNAFSMMWGAFITTIYYQVVLTYAFLYLFHSFKRPLPWSDCFKWWGATPEGCYRRSPEHGSGQRLCDNVRRNLVAAGLNDTGAEHLVAVSYMNRTVLVSQNEYSARFAGCLNANASSTEAFYNDYVLNVSPRIEDAGELQSSLLICYGLCWTLIFLAIFKGIQVSGKVALITATAPYFMLGVMLLRGITLPGASIGLRYLLLPRWEALFDGRVWAAATEQVFYSLSIGTGGLVLYGSFQEFRADMHGSVRIICIMDFMTSAFASLVIFSVLGNLARTLDVPIEEVVSAGPGLAFITYPEALALLTFPNLWSVLFFTMLFMLGIDSQMANCEFVIKSVQDLFPPLEGRREVATFLYCVACFLIGLPLTTRAGLYILTILDNYLGALIRALHLLRRDSHRRLGVRHGPLLLRRRLHDGPVSELLLPVSHQVRVARGAGHLPRLHAGHAAQKHRRRLRASHLGRWLRLGPGSCRHGGRWSSSPWPGLSSVAMTGGGPCLPTPTGALTKPSTGRATSSSWRSRGSPNSTTR